MANYFTQFSCDLDLGSAEIVDRALALLEELRERAGDDDDALYGFEAETDPNHPGKLFITDGDAQGDPEHVICFVLACAEAFDLRGRWGFAWALSCSRARLDGFGGGAQLLDLGARKSLAWMDCAHWLLAMLDPGTNTTQGVAFS